MARVANPYSENEDSDGEDQDYTVVEEGGESLAGSEAEAEGPRSCPTCPSNRLPFYPKG
jgi:hypothetical protein